MPPFSAPLIAEPDDLKFSAQLPVLPGDDVFFAAGAYSADPTEDFFSDQELTAEAIATQFTSLGELAETPGKTESDVEALKTRNYLIPGKRSNTVQITIAGISNAQKAFLESPDFSSPIFTFLLIDRERSRAVIFNGLRWVMEWSAEVDGIFTVNITSEFSGSTTSKVFIIPNIPPPKEEEKNTEE